jgi:recombination protein RecT
VALIGFRKTPKLVECTRQSLLGALMECARLGLAPCTEEASLVPFNNRNKQTKECQLIVGYQGYVQLMYRSGQVEQVVVELVHEADEWEYSLGDGGRFWHKPEITATRADRGAPIFAYSFATLLSGGRTRVATVNLEEAKDLQRKYGVKQDSPWHTNFESMWLKTPVRRIQKFAPKSADLRRAYAVDGATFDLGGVTAAPDEDGVLDGEVIEDTAGESEAPQSPDPQAWDGVKVAQPPGGVQ